MKHRRLIGGVAAAAALVVALAGCGGSGGGGSSGGSKDGDVVTVDWTIWSGSQAEVEAWNHLGEMVTAKYPNIKMNFSTTSFGDYFTKLQTLAAGDQLPCIVATQAQRTPQVGPLLTPLDEQFSADQRAAFDPTIMKALTYDGKVVALPYDIGPYVVYYNKDMFAKAGLKEPAPGWTQEEFVADAKALTGSGKYGFAVTGYPDHWLEFGTSAGGHYLSDDGSKVTLTDDKIAAQWEWVTSLVTKEKVAQAMPATSDENWDIGQWQAGNAAMVIDGPWDYINTKNTVKFDFGIAPIPAVEGKSVSLVTGSGFGVSQTCSYSDEAYKALGVITGEEAAQYLGSVGRAFPARTAQQSAWLDKAGKADGAALQASLKTAEPFLTTNWDSVSTKLFQYGVEAMNGSKPPKAILERVEQEANG